MPAQQLPVLQIRQNIFRGGRVIDTVHPAIDGVVFIIARFIGRYWRLLRRFQIKPVQNLGHSRSLGFRVFGLAQRLHRLAQPGL